MLKLGSVTKDTVLFLVLVFVFNLDLFKFSTAILEKGLLDKSTYVFERRAGTEIQKKVRVGVDHI